jgi:hypothetical protein
LRGWWAPTHVVTFFLHVFINPCYRCAGPLRLLFLTPSYSFPALPSSYSLLCHSPYLTSLSVPPLTKASVIVLQKCVRQIMTRKAMAAVLKVGHLKLFFFSWGMEICVFTSHTRMTCDGHVCEVKFACAFSSCLIVEFVTNVFRNYETMSL